MANGTYIARLTLLTFYLILGFCEVHVDAEEKWLHSVVLDRDGRFWVHWNRDGEEIEFKVEVQAKGYVGFGLSKTGGMAGSDIVTGCIVDGVVHFQDRHGLGNFMPEIDASQDWEMISGKENATHTILRFRRKLHTCDKDHDLEIDQSTMRLIYAYSDHDPSSPDSLQYHYTRRGSRSVMLLQPKLESRLPTRGLSFWDVRSPNFTITSKMDTMYWCKIVRGPVLSRRHHIVKIEPLIQPGSEGLVHHIVMYECIGGDEEELAIQADLQGHQCYHPNMPDSMKKCEGVFAAWGVGGEYLEFPEHVGLPLDPRPPKYYLLEMHYDNPALRGDIRDESGLRIYYTPHLRKYDAGTLMIGAAVLPSVVIPPGQPEYIVSGHGHPDCFAPAMPPGGLKVLAVFLHSHLLGRKIKARHFRGKEELQPLSDNANYDFNYQEYSYLPEEVSMLPGDQITVECSYNSSERKNTTFGGLSSKEEMCLAFVLYYPRIERFGCVSSPARTLIYGLLGVNDYEGTSFYQMLSHADWRQVNVTLFQDALRYSVQFPWCYMGDGTKDQISTLSSYPMNYKPYISEDVCSNGKISSGMTAADGTTTTSSLAYIFMLIVVGQLLPAVRNSLGA